MRWGSDQLAVMRGDAPLRRRTVALALVVGFHALLILLIIRLAPPVPMGGAPSVAAFELIPEPVTEKKKAAEKPKREVRTERREAAPPAPPPIPPEAYELDIIRLTREDYAAADISKLPQRAETASAEAPAEADSAVVGRAPNGERLYKAEWYRPPTDAELAFYLPNGAPRDSWAVIACQTAEKYRVENCVELGQSPYAPGLAASIREAAWQFRVRPPRLGGKPLIGAWVSIRIEFTRAAGD